MKIRVLSDLHLEFGDFDPPLVEADIIVLAGDIWKKDLGIHWARSCFPDLPIVFVLGNHEFYTQEFTDVVDACRSSARERGVHFLENDTVEIAGVRFVGATLWSDFCLDGEAAQQRAMRAAGSMITDFSAVRYIDNECRFRRFGPADALARHEISRKAIEETLAQPFSGPTVVVTHFLPSAESVAERYVGDRLTPYFCSELGHLIRAYQPALWVHGHTHDSCDYHIGRTRVVCNPRGYHGVELNPDFQPDLVIEL